MQHLQLNVSNVIDQYALYQSKMAQLETEIGNRYQIQVATPEGVCGKGREGGSFSFEATAEFFNAQTRVEWIRVRERVDAIPTESSLNGKASDYH